jgi:hypothetical protein
VIGTRPPITQGVIEIPIATGVDTEWLPNIARLMRFEASYLYGVEVSFVFANRNLPKVTRLKLTCHLKRSDFPPFSERLLRRKPASSQEN